MKSTAAGTKFNSIIRRYGKQRKSNPSSTVTAISADEVEVATTKKKKLSPAQKKHLDKLHRAARKKAREKKRAKKSKTTKAKRRTTKRKAAKKSSGGWEAASKPTYLRKKKSSKRKTKRTRKTKTTTITKQAAVVAAMTEGEPVAARKKRRKSAKKRKTTTKRKRKTTAKRKRTTTKRKRKAAKRRRSTTRRTRSRTESARFQSGNRTITLRVAPTTAPKRTKRKSKRRKRKKNPIDTAALAARATNPVGSIIPNPIGPLTMNTAKGLAVAGAGIGVGLVFADMLDRYLATRTPPNSKNGTEAKSPWYGRNAVLMQQKRPDVVRMGAQVAGSAGSIVIAMWSAKARMPVLPWLASGAAIAFASNFFMKLVNWYVMPKIFSVKDPSEATLANRLFPAEQDEVQDQVDTLLEEWALVEDLKNNQLEEPVIVGPLAADQSQSVLTLGGHGEPAQPEGLPLGVAGRAAPFVETGREGMCGSCGAMNGCYASCPGLDESICAPCADGDGGGSHPNGGGGGGRDDGGGGGGGGTGRRTCAYVVREGDDPYRLAAAAGTNINDLNALNNGRTPDDYWKPGNEVVLSYEMCIYISRTPETPSRTPTTPVTTSTPVLTKQPPTPVDRPVLADSPDTTLIARPTSTPSILAVAGVPNDDDESAERESRLTSLGMSDDD